MKSKLLFITFLLFKIIIVCKSQPDTLQSKDYTGIFFTLNTESNIYIDQKSKGFYDKLSDKLFKSKYTSYLGEYLLVENEEQNDSTTNNTIIYSDYNKLKGKRITSIETHAVDIIDGDVRDTSHHVKTLISKSLDNIHIKTRDFVLKHNLLFKVGDTLNPYLISDNERIIRELEYITDAIIYVQKNLSDTNTVSVLLITQDKFSIGASAGGSGLQNYDVSLFDQNFLGYGYRLEGRYFKTTENENNGYHLNYNANNLVGSFINLNLSYKNRTQNKERSISLFKPFLSPYTKNIGGLLIMNEVYEFNSISEDSIISMSNVNTQTYDFWIGRTFLLKEGNKRKNIVLSIRNSYKNHLQRPFISPDSNATFHDNQLVLGKISYLKTRFFKTYNLIQFGVTEDIVYGYSFGFTFGNEKRDFYNRYYSGVNVALGYYSEKNGYFGSDFRAGLFFNNENHSDLKLDLSLLYFTRLLKIGSFQYRGIIIPNYNYIHIPTTTVNYLKTDDKIHYFPNYKENITQKALLTSEHLFFSKWKVIGFKIALLTFFDIGYFNGENHKTLFTKENIFGSTGLGFRVRNEFLSFSSIEVRFNFAINTPEGYSPFQFTFETSKNRPYYSYQNQRPEIVNF